MHEFIRFIAYSAIIGVAIIVMLGFFSRPKKLTLNCSDKCAKPPSECSLGHSEFQVPWRIVSPVQIDFEKVEIYRTKEQCDGEFVTGMAILEHLRDRSSVSGKLLCPYPDILGHILKESPSYTPRSWKSKRVWFFVPYFHEDLMCFIVVGCEWDESTKSVYLPKRRLTDRFGPYDGIAIDRIDDPDAKADAKAEVTSQVI